MALIDKYSLYEDKCLIFSEGNQNLEKIIERILLITSFTFFREDWQCSSKIVKWNLETLWEKYCSYDFDLKASFDAIIIFEEKEDDRLNKFIFDFLKVFSYYFCGIKERSKLAKKS